LNIGLFFSAKEALFAAYKRRLDDKIGDLKSRLAQSGQTLIDDLESGLSLLEIGDEGKRTSFLTIHVGSPYWPNPQKSEDATAAEVLGGIGIIVQIASPKYPDLGDRLMMGFGGRIDGRRIGEPIDRGGITLIYDVDRSRISLHLTGLRNYLPVAPTRAFLSIVDFEGSDVTVAVPTHSAAPMSPPISLGEFDISFGRNVRSLFVLKWTSRVPDRIDHGRFSGKLVYRVDDHTSSSGNGPFGGDIKR
jgi:hypothetical protein